MVTCNWIIKWCYINVTQMIINISPDRQMQWTYKGQVSPLTGKKKESVFNSSLTQFPISTFILILLLILSKTVCKESLPVFLIYHFATAID